MYCPLVRATAIVVPKKNRLFGVVVVVVVVVGGRPAVFVVGWAVVVARV